MRLNEKVFRSTNVVTEQDPDTKKPYDLNRCGEGYYIRNVHMQLCESKMPKRRKRVEFTATVTQKKKKKVSFLAKRKKK